MPTPTKSTTSPSGESSTASSPSTPTERPASLAAALAKLQTMLPTVRKGETATVPTKAGGKYTYTYATLADVSEAVLPLMGQCGLSWSTKPTYLMQRDAGPVFQAMERLLSRLESDRLALPTPLLEGLLQGIIDLAPTVSGEFVLHWILRHESGESDEGWVPLPDPVRSDWQQVGSAITYARRYCLGAVTGIAVDDDDDAQKVKGQPAAGEQPPEPSGRAWDLEVAEAKDIPTLQRLWREAGSYGELTAPLKEAITARGTAIQAAEKAAADTATDKADSEALADGASSGATPTE